VKLKIADDLTFSAEAITETFAVLGIRGSGKTNTAVVMAEQMIKANQQVVVLDPTDAKLRDGARRMLDVLVAAGGEFVGREDLAQAAGMTKSGTFTTYLSDLRTARLVVIENRGVAVNRETLFL
jgi:ABC-type Na+ transport system ATPase subunit NatA